MMANPKQTIQGIKNLEDKALILKLNDFLKPPRRQSLLPNEEEEKESIMQIDTHYDFDHPSAVDWGTLMDALDNLMKMNPVCLP